MKKSPRKPRETAREIYPKIEVSDGKIWLQSSPSGKWIKIPKKRALYLSDRLKRSAESIISRAKHLEKKNEKSDISPAKKQTPLPLKKKTKKKRKSAYMYNGKHSTYVVAQPPRTKKVPKKTSTNPKFKIRKKI